MPDDTPAAEPTNQKPRHIAIIMDGNGRWAERRNKMRFMGHILIGELLNSIFCLTLFILRDLFFFQQGFEMSFILYVWHSIPNSIPILKKYILTVSSFHELDQIRISYAGQLLFKIVGGWKSGSARPPTPQSLPTTYLLIWMKMYNLDRQWL